MPQRGQISWDELAPSHGLKPRDSSQTGQRSSIFMRPVNDFATERPDACKARGRSVPVASWAAPSRTAPLDIPDEKLVITLLDCDSHGLRKPLSVDAHVGPSDVP